MEITFNPLFDYKGIARDALQGLGLDEKYLQDKKEKPTLADGFGSKPIENNNFEEGFGSKPIDYGVPQDQKQYQNMLTELLNLWHKGKKN